MIMKRALFLGRFQPFHKGHLFVIEQAIKVSDELVIAIGSAQHANTPDNPFSADERVEMAKRALAKYEGHCLIVKVEDIYCDEKYVDHVIKQTGRVDVVFAAENQTTRLLFKAKGYKVIIYDRFSDISGTRVREKMAKGQEWEKDVPDEVASYIKSINGADRIRAI